MAGEARERGPVAARSRYARSAGRRHAGDQSDHDAAESRAEIRRSVALTTLAIATSADTCSVALLADEEVVAIRTFAHEMRLLERLVPIMDAVLSDASVTLAEVDLLATDLGPGSFTGIRIGITTIKTIAWAQGKQAVGIPSLECIAAEARREHVVALIRARPGLAYRQVFGSGPTPMGDAAMVTIESALSGLD
ncbi:MAG: tRNA (adenosine(37)-N6)-threonylcarbamoyltransferase complex dimerization subunit type 1 TsaB, partial [Armatimonadetes bacterium]|nr:tRNA (adenosine(37)-N6)-threonylcarbamoyltransferase complex dimerization subunit type 1 TsaB [Armatimonadota bacterium]